jgi:CRP/FNR family transcriptional regulator, cyclic AMP receptor protein
MKERSNQPHEPLLGDAELRDLGPGVHRVSYPRGSLLTSAGENTDFVVYLLEGHVKTVQRHPDVLSGIHRPGTFVGELAALTGQCRSADIVALTDITALLIPADVFLKLITDDPRVALSVTRALAERVQRLVVQSESITTAEQKFAHAVLGIAKAGIGDVSGESLELEGFNQRDLAALAGISRESVAAILRPLKVSGAVSIGRQRLTIHDLDHFEAIAQRVDHAL